MAIPIYKGTDANNMPVFRQQKYIYAICDIQWRDGTCGEDLIFNLIATSLRKKTKEYSSTQRTMSRSYRSAKMSFVKISEY